LLPFPFSASSFRAGQLVFAGTVLVRRARFGGAHNTCASRHSSRNTNPFIHELWLLIRKFRPDSQPKNFRNVTEPGQTRMDRAQSGIKDPQIDWLAPDSVPCAAAVVAVFSLWFCIPRCAPDSFAAREASRTCHASDDWD
jgi:hypothetical protein